MSRGFKNLLSFSKNTTFIDFIEESRMVLDYETRRIIQLGISTALVFILMTYFLFHAIKGERGILAWSRLEDKLIEKEYELASIESQWKVLDQKVKKLGNVICSDLLEEQSIRILGFSHPEDVVVLED